MEFAVKYDGKSSGCHFSTVTEICCLLDLLQAGEVDFIRISRDAECNVGGTISDKVQPSLLSKVESKISDELDKSVPILDSLTELYRVLK